VLLGGQRLFSKKFAATSQFVVSSRMWSRTIPTANCDVLVTLPSTIEDDVLIWVLARLRARVPELSVCVRDHSSTGIYGFYLTASFEKYGRHCSSDMCLCYFEFKLNIIGRNVLKYDFCYHMIVVHVCSSCYVPLYIIFIVYC